MPANNRIYYASQAIALLPQNSDGSDTYSTTWYRPRGIQSVGITTNFNLEQIFQLGQLEIYDQVEDVPEIEVTINKIIDGTPPLYLMCMGGSGGISGANGVELATLANNRVNFKLGVYSDSVTATTGNPQNYVDCSGMYLSSVSYTIPVDGSATEDVTLVGNNKVWNTALSYANGPANLTSNFAVSASGSSPSTARRYSLSYADSVLPTGTGGIPLPASRSEARPYLQNITISMDLGREAINELGRMAPYFRYVNFPVEVTSEFEVVSADGDRMNAKDFSDQAGCAGSYKNLTDKTVKVVICGSGAGNSLTIDLGAKNKLTSVNYTGGDTGGGNATATYSFQTFNKFVVSGAGDFVNEVWIDGTNDGSYSD
jgi:hypothetical protein